MEGSFVAICAVGIAAVLISICLRRLQKEYAMLLTFSAAVGILLWVLGEISPLLGEVQTLFAEADLSRDTVTVLLQCAGIAVLSRFLSDLCKDTGENTLGFAVELAARCSMLVCCLPMLTQLFDFVRRLL